MKSIGRILLLSLGSLLVTQCSKVKNDDQRGLASQAIADGVGSGDAVGEDSTIIDGKAVITDAGDLPPLSVAAEVDVSAMPEGFLEDISHISKISPTKTLIYSKIGFSWLLDEERQGLLTKLQSNVTVPTGTRMFMQEGQHFWLYSATSIAFPSSVPSEALGQVTLLNITPELLADPNHKLLFVGPNSVILGNDSKANILTRDGDKVRALNLDLPKQGGQPVAVTAAGQGDSPDLFWFLTADQLLLLKRNPGNQWVWRVAKFKVDPGIAGTPGQVAMLLASPGEKEVTFVGRTFVLNAGKLFEKDALKFSLPDEKAAAIEQTFLAGVQPLIKNNCIACHPGFDAQAVAMEKAAAIKTHLMNKTMPPPPGTPLSDADTKTILDWFASIPL
jgi:hypothetical protein